MMDHKTIVLSLILAALLAGPVIADEPRAELEAKAQQALAAGDLRDAVAALERLRFQGDLSDRLRLGLAQTYYRLGELDQAAAEATQTDPTAGGSELVILQAQLAASESDWASARDRYAGAIRMVPDNAEAYLGLGQALQELGDQAGADAAFQGYVQYSD